MHRWLSLNYLEVLGKPTNQNGERNSVVGIKSPCWKVFVLSIKCILNFLAFWRHDFVSISTIILHAFWRDCWNWPVEVYKVEIRTINWVSRSCYLTIFYFILGKLQSRHNARPTWIVPGPRGKNLPRKFFPWGLGKNHFSVNQIVTFIHQG